MSLHRILMAEHSSFSYVVPMTTSSSLSTFQFREICHYYWNCIGIELAYRIGHACPKCDAGFFFRNGVLFMLIVMLSSVSGMAHFYPDCDAGFCFRNGICLS